MSTLKKDTRQRCLEAAVELIRSQGYDALSMREVAREAGVSATAPYRHFESREDLLSAVAADGFLLLSRQLHASCEEGVHHLTMEKFNAMGLAYIGFAQQYPERYRLMFGTTLPSFEIHPERAAAAEGTFKILKDAVEVLQRAGELVSGEPERIAIHIWSLSHGWASLFIEGRLEDRLVASSWQEEWLEHWAIAVAGLSARH